jgi:hypothetical protein
MQAARAAYIECKAYYFFMPSLAHAAHLPQCGHTKPLFLQPEQTPSLIT